MRFTLTSFPLKNWGLVAFVIIGTVAETQAQTVAQGFEGSAADTWAYTPTPAPYNVPADNDQWAILPSVGTAGAGLTVALPSAGANLWGGRDLQGPQTNDLSVWHYLDFAPVAIQPGAAAANTVSFKYFSNAFDNPDSLAYVVQFDNGSTWPLPRTYTQLNKDTQAWTTITVAVPAGSTHARLRLAVRQNGNDDWIAFDEISLGRTATAVPDLGFTGTTLSVAENAGTVSLPLSIRNANATASTVQVQVQVAPLGTATAGADYTFAATQTVTFAPGSTTATLTLPILDDNVAEPAEYFSVRLLNPTNATLTAGATEFLVFIKDNDTAAPARDRNLRLNLLGSYQNGVAGTNSAEIVAHDPTTQRLYVVNSVGAKLDILNFATPGMLTPVASVSVTPYGNINSVAVRNGLVACAIEDGTLPQNPGKVVFFDQNGVFLKQVTVGSLPDMVTFTPDGHYLVTANEGEPSADYRNDPNGSVSLIDLSGINGNIANLTQANVTTLDFTAYNAQAAALRTAGIRIFGGPTGGPASTVAQDLEPEYVTISPDSRTAYVGLQENNALATIDLATRTITSLRSVGYQDHSQPGFSFDASDQTADVLLANWPVRGMRQPDAIDAFELPAALGGGRYIITANEGDAREYAGFTETTRLGDAGYVLDPTAFPQAALLKNNSALGRLTVTKSTGDTDGDGDIDQIHAFGGRSFSILNASTGATVYDSGDLLERLTSTDAAFGSLFNASNTTGAPVRKNRSDDKGPEPEGLTIGTLRDTTYAFVSMERVGGVAVFNINNPAAPRLVDYVNNRSLTAGTGDLGPEGTLFIPASESPTGQPLLLLANEVSSTVAVYGIQLRGTVVTATRSGRAAEALQLYPNPAQGGAVRLSRPVSGTLLDVLGRPVRQLQAATQFETTGLTAGIYVLKAADGATARLVVK